MSSTEFSTVNTHPFDAILGASAKAILQVCANQILRSEETGFGGPDMWTLSSVHERCVWTSNSVHVHVQPRHVMNSAVDKTRAIFLSK